MVAFNIATRNCAEAAPDGYTICLLPGEPLTYNQFLFKNPGFDPTKIHTDHQPVLIARSWRSHTSLGKGPRLELASAYRSRKPGTLSYTSPALRTHPVHRGVQEANGRRHRLGAVQGRRRRDGELPVRQRADRLRRPRQCPALSRGRASQAAGRADGNERSPLIPDVPTVQETGYTGVDLTRAYFGLVAPAKAPPNAIATLHRASPRSTRIRTSSRSS